MALGSQEGASSEIIVAVVTHQRCSCAEFSLVGANT